MAKLCDIVKPGVPCRVRCGSSHSYQWDGKDLMAGNCSVVSGEFILFANDWQLDEPTVESVLRERGYQSAEGCASFPPTLCLNIGSSHKGDAGLVRVPVSKLTPAMATEIADLLDRFK